MLTNFSRDEHVYTILYPNDISKIGIPVVEILVVPSILYPLGVYARHSTSLHGEGGPMLKGLIITPIFLVE